MVATIIHKGAEFRVDFSKPLDISIPLRAGEPNVNAWYVPPVKIEPVRMGDWVGDVNQGGPVNFKNIFLNPHGNGTHTECVGHISREPFTLNQCLKTFFFLCEVISVLPEELANGDWVIGKKTIQASLGDRKTEALALRTLSNPPEKINQHYSNTNPPYLTTEAMQFILDAEVDHLLTDMPSVDKEKDDGSLVCHHLFWDYPSNPKTGKTISELIYIPNHIPDGSYLLNLQITSLESDASPSKPCLYRIIP